MLWAWLLACQADCEADRPCRVEGGAYLTLPPSEQNGGSVPALVFFHGYGSSAGAQRRRPVPRAWAEAGWLVVLPEGEQNTWAHVGSPSTARDEQAFVAAVLDDVEARWPVSRVVVTGFSQGSSMAWDVACYQPSRVDALLGASGAFWEPLPRDCAGPVPVRHTHGLDDTVVPMDGRPIGAARQGDVRDGIDVWLATNGCAGEPTIEVDGPETCEVYACASGPVSLCVYDGAHRHPDGWTGRMLRFVEGLP